MNYIPEKLPIRNPINPVTFTKAQQVAYSTVSDITNRIKKDTYTKTAVRDYLDTINMPIYPGQGRYTILKYGVLDRVCFSYVLTDKPKCDTVSAVGGAFNDLYNEIAPSLGWTNSQYKNVQWIGEVPKLEDYFLDKSNKLKHITTTKPVYALEDDELRSTLTNFGIWNVRKILPGTRIDIIYDRNGKIVGGGTGVILQNLPDDVDYKKLVLPQLLENLDSK